MFSEISSFLEVSFALYASICIDGKYGLKIWKPSVSPSLKQFLEEEPIWKKSCLENKIEEYVKITLEESFARVRQAGRVMLTLCLFLLIYMGFEEKWGGQVCFLSFEVILLVCFLTIFSILSSDKQRVYLIISVALFISLLTLLIAGFCVNDFSVICNYILSENKVKFFAVIVILSSLLFDFAWCFLMKRKYYKYIERYLSRELVNLKKVYTLTVGDENAEQLEAIFSTMPEPYLKLYARMLLHNDDTTDVKTDEFETAFYTSLKEACPLPTFFSLLFDSYEEKGVMNSSEEQGGIANNSTEPLSAHEAENGPRRSSAEGQSGQEDRTNEDAQTTGGSREGGESDGASGQEDNHDDEGATHEEEATSS